MMVVAWPGDPYGDEDGGGHEELADDEGHSVGQPTVILRQGPRHREGGPPCWACHHRSGTVPRTAMPHDVIGAQESRCRRHPERGRQLGHSSPAELPGQQPADDDGPGRRQRGPEPKASAGHSEQIE